MLNASGVDRLILLSYNPFRYRGYYYDTDSGWYYLQSRYYNPTWGRFLNADTYVNANGDMIGYNMFAYCSNNPIMEIDPTGEVILSTLLIGAFVGLVVNTTASIVVQGITNGWENIDANQVVFDGLMGAVSGAVGASGIGAVGSIIIGGALNVVGSIGSDLIASDGDWSTVNIGKALVMGAVGAGLGKWAGAGAQNTKAMCNAVNMGKSWGAKMFNAFCGSVSDQGMSQLTRQTAALYMRNAVLGYKVQAITSTAISLIGSAMAGTFFNIFD